MIFTKIPFQDSFLHKMNNIPANSVHLIYLVKALYDTPKIGMHCVHLASQW
jgi:hypothetical protein